MYVKVTRKSDASAWYDDHIDEIFEVESNDDNWYSVVENGQATNKLIHHEHATEVDMLSEFTYHCMANG